MTQQGVCECSTLPLRTLAYAQTHNLLSQHGNTGSVGEETLKSTLITHKNQGFNPLSEG